MSAGLGESLKEKLAYTKLGATACTTYAKSFPRAIVSARFSFFARGGGGDESTISYWGEFGILGKMLGGTYIVSSELCGPVLCDEVKSQQSSELSDAAPRI